MATPTFAGGKKEKKPILPKGTIFNPDTDKKTSREKGVYKKTVQRRYKNLLGNPVEVTKEKEKTPKTVKKIVTKKRKYTNPLTGRTTEVTRTRSSRDGAKTDRIKY
jgi:hypothetical protein